jgi:NAD+ diphosphatase
MHNFIIQITPQTETDSFAYWFIFYDKNLLTRKPDALPLFSSQKGLKEDYALGVKRVLYLGLYQSIPCYAAQAEHDRVSHPELLYRPLRRLYGTLPEDFFQIACYALQIIQWDKSTQFCSTCGSPTVLDHTERMKVCSRCGYNLYPKISPAIIVAIIKNNSILLARNERFQGKWYSVLAGYVEVNESLEDCVRREIKEEVNLEVANIRYFKSQGWAFSDSLMIGFIADYAGGELIPDGKEIKEAGWFTRDALPSIPGPPSIAYELIQHFIKNY